MIFLLVISFVYCHIMYYSCLVFSGKLTFPEAEVQEGIFSLGLCMADIMSCVPRAGRYSQTACSFSSQMK